MVLGLFRRCSYRIIPQCAFTVPQMIPAVELEWCGAREPNHLHLANCSLPTASQFTFPIYMSFLPFFLGDLHMVCCGCNPKLQCLVIPNKLFFFFWKNNLQSVVVQHSDGPYWNPEKTPKHFKADEQRGTVFTWSTLLLIAFLVNPGV